MPFASPFVLTTCEGIFGTVTTPAEIWRCTWKIAVPNGTPVDLDKLDQYVNDIQAAVAAFHVSTNGAPNASDNAKLVSLAAALVGPDGKYLGGANQPTTRFTYATPVSGTGTQTHPLSTAICVTLRSNLLRGRAHAGRFYWPALAAVANAPNGTVLSAYQSGLATKAKTLLDNVNVAAETQWGDFANVSVMSNLGTGTTGTVERVEVGARLDSQERRERSIPEAYLGVDLAVATSLRRARQRALLET